MKLSEFCIHRPVFTIVLSLVLIVVGIIGFDKLTVRELPSITFPVVTISTNYFGANPDLIESQITNPIEETLSNIDGLTDISSTSSQDISNIRLKFDLGTDMNVATSQIRDKLATVVGQLPKDAEQPVLYRIDTDEFEDVDFGFSDKNKSVMELTDYIDRYIKPQLEQIDGVASIGILGGRFYSMRLWLYPNKMAANKISVSEVKNALIAQNIDVSSGYIRSKSRLYNILVKSKLQTAEAFNNLIIKDDKGYLIRFSDIGKAELAPEDENSAARIDGKNTVVVSISAQSNANPITVSNNAIEKLNEIKKTLPHGMQAQVVYNAAEHVNASINNTYRAVFESIFLVILVVFLFLGSFRATAVPIVTIPICLISLFAFIYVLGFTINLITLLAIVLAIGLVVDDAIVMLENIHRHVEKGEKPFAAAILGSREIGFAIVAMTITLAAVYAPISFTPGMTGIVFMRFAFTLAIAVLISGFIALTLSPMMCARIVGNKDTRYSIWLEKIFFKFINFYKNLLQKVLMHRLIIIGILLALIFAGAIVYNSFSGELAPSEDRGIIHIMMDPPTNSTFDYNDFYAKKIEKLVSNVPEMKKSIGFVEDFGANFHVLLKKWNERKRSQQQIEKELNAKFQKMPGARIYALRQTSFGGGGRHGDAVEFVLMTTQDYKYLNSISSNIVKLTKEWQGFGNVDSDMKMDSTQYEVSINRDLAANLKVSINDIADTLSTMVGGARVTRFAIQGKDYNVILQLRREKRRDIDVIKNLYVRNNENKMIPLSALVTIKNIVGPKQLPHFNRLRSAKITAQLKYGYEMSDAIKVVQKIMSQHLPDDVKYQFTSAAKRYIDSSHTMLLVFSLAIIFIYLVLGAQFESFIDPFIILLTVPLSIVGALFTLKLVGGTLNIYSNIGFVTLIGLISKHGILITDFANKLRAQGKELNEAIVEAASLRIRPILMTTAAMSIGALPLALATGAGADQRHQIGWVIVGGLIFGTFFSLFVVPVAYSFLGKFRKIN